MPRRLLLLSLVALVASEDAAASGVPLVNGNIGLTGAGYGDVYGGTIKEGVYGAGGRVGGQLGLTGLLGLGGGRRKRQASASAFASASANASGDGGVAIANASAFAGVEPAKPPATTAAPAARRKRQDFGFVPFSSLGMFGSAPPAAPAPAADAAPAATEAPAPAAATC